MRHHTQQIAVGLAAYFSRFIPSYLIYVCVWRCDSGCLGSHFQMIYSISLSSRMFMLRKQSVCVCDCVCKRSVITYVKGICENSRHMLCYAICVGTFRYLRNPLQMGLWKMHYIFPCLFVETYIIFIYVMMSELDEEWDMIFAAGEYLS